MPAVSPVIRRNTFATAMEVLSVLRDGPLGASRLAQRCNINYGRLDATLSPLSANGWIERRQEQGEQGQQEAYALTERGLEAYARYEMLWNEFQRGLKLTTGQERF